MLFGEQKKEEPKMGRWWKTIFGSMYFIEGMEDNLSCGWGYCSYGIWFEKITGYTVKHLDRPATEQEIEAVLIEEAKRREVWDTPNFNPVGDISSYNSYGICSEVYFGMGDRLWSSYGIVYEKGKWATPAETKKTYTLDGGTVVTITEEGIFADGKEWTGWVEVFAERDIHQLGTPRPVKYFSYEIGCEVVRVDQIKEILDIYEKLK